MILSKIKHKKLLIGIDIAVILIAIFVLTAFLYYNSKLNKIHFNFDSDVVIDTDVEITDDAEMDLSYLPEGDPTHKIVAPYGEIYKNSDVMNILLLGTDDRTKELSDNARSDSMMVLSINKKLKTAKLVSLERAIGVPIEGREPDWLTHTFRYGGAYLTMNTVRDCFLLDINKFVRVNFRTFTEIIDTVGGVEITLTAAEAGAINQELSTGKYVAGGNLLNGESALAYSRLRHIDSDWQRIGRQRAVIQAVVTKSKGLSVSEINELADNILPLVETNLTKAEITSLLLEAPHFLGASLGQMTIPEKDTYWSYISSDGRSLIAIDFIKNANALRKFLYE